MFVLRKLGSFILTLVLISIITFSVFFIIPGDPAMIMLGVDAQPEQIEALREDLGLNTPIYQRYLDWIKGFVGGDLGESFRFEQPVNQLLTSRLPVTASLTFMSLVFIIIFSIPLGVLAAKSHRGISDYLITIITQLGMAVPSFWLGIILLILLGGMIEGYGSIDYISWTEKPIKSFQALLLPSLAIAIPQIAIVVRYLRVSILEQLQKDYVRTAKSKGLLANVILYKHVLKNAMIPVLTIMGMILARILAGSIVLEQVFALPGLGRLLVTSISYRDFPLLSGMIMYIALVVIIINFVVDLFYRVVDPRIKLS